MLHKVMTVALVITLRRVMVLEVVVAQVVLEVMDQIRQEAVAD
jgi:hypothetical protein